MSSGGVCVRRGTQEPGRPCQFLMTGVEEPRPEPGSQGKMSGRRVRHGTEISGRRAVPAHLPMIVFRQKTGACELVRSRGIYLNFKKNIAKATKNAEFTLNSGDILVLYTDGLTEAKNSEGELLDIVRFMGMVEAHADEGTEMLRDSVVNDVLEWCDGKRADDMSLMVVRRTA